MLDPRWNLLGDEVRLEEIDEPYEPTRDPETGERLDFLFILQPKAPAPLDELLVVEIKRGHRADGSVHRANDVEVNKFHSYVLGVREQYTLNSSPPLVNGLMIANGYTRRANRVRESLQGVQQVKLEFRTWDSMLENTRRLHTGWLEVTRKSSNQDDQE